MRMLFVLIAMVLSTNLCLGQTPDGAILGGKWTYRSFHNSPAPVTDDPKTAAERALALIFAEAVITLETPSSTVLKGAIDWPGGGLDLQGTFQLDSAGPTLSIIGTGRANTDTAGWEYDYRGQLAYHWPNGINQVPALVGTVIRAKPHNGAAAGYTASFVAVKRP